MRCQILSIPLLLSIVMTCNGLDSYLKDLAETHTFTLGRPKKVQPAPDGKSALFLRATASRTPKMALYEFDAEGGQTRELLTAEQVLNGQGEQLSLEEKARRERTRTRVTGFTAFEIAKDGSQVLLTLAGKIYLFNRATKAVTPVRTEAGIIDPHFSPDGRWIAYVRNNNLFAYDLHADKEYAISTGGTETISYGVAEFVAQEEMDRTDGFWWTADGSSLVYQMNDSTGVDVWNIADPASPEKPPSRSVYPRPGRPNVSVKLAIRSRTGSGEPKWIEWDREKYPYVVQVRQMENGPLTLTVATRNQHELLLLTVDIATGQTAKLLSEQDPGWVNFDQQMPYWLPGGRFLWTNEKAGDWQLELHRADGGLEKVISSPDAAYRQLVGISHNSLYFVAGPDPTERQIYKVSLDDQKIEQVTKDVGVHKATFGEPQQQDAIYVDQVQSPSSLEKVSLHRLDGTLIGELPSIAEEPPSLPHLEFLTVSSNPEFQAVIVRPSDFDPQKQYPVIVSVYGGPHYNQVMKEAGNYLVDQWRADQGFIVVAFDGRGTPGRGHDWEHAIYEKLGSVPLQDQVTALQALGEKFKELDMSRVGIAGWSVGGYLSALATLARPDVYKAGVAGAPVTDWMDYDSCYTERYLGLPEATKSAYDAASLLPLAPQLKRPLLLIHGTVDDNVYFRHTLKLIDALERAGKDFEFAPVSRSTHMANEPEMREFVETRVIEFFKKNL
jgi:dipeptidyl-peptidase-4